MAETIVKKAVNGWEATTYIDLEDIGFTLELSTRKSNPGIATVAMAVQRTGGGMIQHRLYQDYYKVLARHRQRATEKNIRALHDEALFNIDDVIEAVKQHYSK